MIIDVLFTLYRLLISSQNGFTVKPVLSGHSKIDKTKILMTNGHCLRRHDTGRINLSAKPHHDRKVGFVSICGVHYPKHYVKKVASTEWL